MKKKRILGLISILIVATLVSGCAKERSDYECKVSYSYNDSQDNNTNLIQPNYEETQREVSNEGMTDSQSEQNIQQTTEQKANNVENITNTQIEDETAQKTNDEATPTVIDHSIEDSSETQDSSSGEVDKQIDPQSDTQSEINEQQHGEEEDFETEHKGDTPTDEGEESIDYDDEKSTETTPTEGGDEETSGESEAQYLDPEKIVSLSYEGELGTYIWGETPNLSLLIVTAKYEDGHEEVITNYNIDMNYPERIYKSIPSTTINAEQLYAFPRILDLRTYTPGIYEATISAQEATVNVPYELIIMFAGIVFFNNYKCTDPEGHKVIRDQNGEIIDCDGGCFVSPEYSTISGKIIILDIPLYNDYVLTIDDIVSDPFFFSTFPGIENAVFERFPVVNDKNAATAQGNYEFRSTETGTMTIYSLRELEAR